MNVGAEELLTPKRIISRWEGITNEVPTKTLAEG
jgi:hypothetical protein